MSGRIYAGIDLTASPKRETAVCVVELGSSAEFIRVRTDEELIDVVVRRKPRVTAIDAPLTRPRAGRALRRCDEEVRRLGVPILPPAMGPMRLLTERGVRVAGSLRESGLRVIEVYPRGVQRMLGLIGRGERPGPSVARRVAPLLGVTVAEDLSVDEVDALTCALLAYLHDEGKTVELGDPGEGTIAMPSTGALENVRRLLCPSER